MLVPSAPIRYSPPSVEDWVDLECGEARVARVQHQRHVWRTWSMLWKVMLVLLVLGYVFNYAHAVLKRRRRLQWLLHGVGEPRECETVRRLARGQGLTMDEYFHSWFVDHTSTCERYHDEVYRLRWGFGVLGLIPSPWGVAIDMLGESVVQPLHHVVQLLVSIPIWLTMPFVVVVVVTLVAVGTTAPTVHWLTTKPKRQ